MIILGCLIAPKMKNTLFLLLITTTFLSCKSNSKKVTTDSTISASPLSSQLLKQYKPYFDGIWVVKDYVNDLGKTRSPYKSRNKLGGVAGLEINIGLTHTDSTMAGVSLNNHEGTNFTIYSKAGVRGNSLKINWKDYGITTNFYELGYSIDRNDTILILYHYNKDHQLLDSTCYLKVVQSESKNDMGYGIQYITNKILITGNYNLIDSTGHTEKVEFTNEGNVSGFLGFKTYYINTDFEAGPENNIDEITFDLYTKKQKDYAYTFNTDTLTLYETTANADSTKLFLGKMAYTLVKIR